MIKSSLPLTALASFSTGLLPLQASAEVLPPPNLVYILVDDMGFGDVSCLNPKSKIHTPNLDRLAASGMIFTDAHTNSAVCTPTRYGILTGRHAWRTHLRSGVLWGFSEPLIPADRPTVASFLKGAGYNTAAVGKWHLGMSWPLLEQPTVPQHLFHDPKMDWSQPIQNGPTPRGFDTFFGISASLDMPPYAYIEGDRIVGEITTKKNFFRNRLGPATADFEPEKVLKDFSERAQGDIARLAAEKKPFFLYLALNSPHTPIVPRKEFQGVSGLNNYADFVIETDAVVGEILDKLEQVGVRENTLVIFTSDNGCSPEADFPTLLEAGHNPSHVFRGHKADLFDGGHRVPFLVSWPARVQPGTVCDTPICVTDSFATAADFADRPIPEDAAEDSFSLLPLLTGRAKDYQGEFLVHQSVHGGLSIRRGPWKLLFAPGSAGWSEPKGENLSGLPKVQLYNLLDDPGETKNVQAEHPELVAELTAAMQKLIDQGRSTPGPQAKNDVEVPIFLP